MRHKSISGGKAANKKPQLGKIVSVSAGILATIILTTLKVVHTSQADEVGRQVIHEQPNVPQSSETPAPTRPSDQQSHNHQEIQPGGKGVFIEHNNTVNM
jgi:hypothetical protein